MSPFTQGWSASGHKALSCTNCHPLSKAAGRINEGVAVLKSLTGQYQPGEFATGSSGTCKQVNCHLGLEKKMSQRKVRFGHALHDEKKIRPRLRCTSCHFLKPGKGHFSPDKSLCFLCHTNRNSASIEGFAEFPSGCFFCHQEISKKIPGTKNEIVHARVNGVAVKCSLCHAHAFLAPNKVERATCFKCHDKAGGSEIEQIEGGMHGLHKESRIPCTGCHPLLNHNPKQKAVPEKKECKRCHPVWYESSRAIYRGEGAMGVAPWPNPMEEAGIGCQGCHTLNPSSRSINPFGSLEKFKARCISCHGDTRYGEVLSQWQGVLGSLLKRVERLLTKVEEAIKKNPEGSGIQTRAKEISANIALVIEGRGVHNYGYAVYVLEVAEEGLRLLLGHSTEKSEKHALTKNGIFLYSSSDKVLPATFNHRKHQKSFPDCRECHEKYFSMHFGSATGSGVFTMKNMERGWFCGACHNGKRAFSVKGSCDTCHRKGR
ncbi:MAG: cytochrome c3 family protein [Nitrospinota bacterium]